METMELGHANVQVDFSRYEQFGSKEEKLQAVADDLTSDEYMRVRTGKRGATSVKTRSEEEVENELRNGSATALLPWHYDSYPWVCVAMISDTTDMVGGETVIQRGDGRFVGVSHHDHNNNNFHHGHRR